jgi:hypothetical protein
LQQLISVEKDKNTKWAWKIKKKVEKAESSSKKVV